jgi:hypothetical protein
MAKQLICVNLWTIKKHPQITQTTNPGSLRNKIMRCACTDFNQTRASHIMTCIRKSLVPKRGLEPPHLAVLDPKSSVSTKFHHFGIIQS